MTEFVSIEGTESESLNIPQYTTESIEQETKIEVEELPTYETTEPEPLCVKEQCSTPYQICKDDSGYFKIDNLLGELLTEYQKNRAKQNLGIGTEYDLIWENIQGNFKNTTAYNELIKDLNSINASLVTQLNTSISDVINYVKDKTAKAASIILFEVTPTEVTYTGTPQTVTVKWGYVEGITITKQSINGTVLDNDVRTYTFNNVTDTLTITLQYVFNSSLSTGLSAEYASQCNIYYPVLFGSSLVNLSAQKDFPVTVTSSNYIYIASTKEQILSVNGLIGGFQKQDSIVRYGKSYYVYKTKEQNLGTITVYDK